MEHYLSTKYPGVVYYQKQKSKDKTFYITYRERGKLKREKIGNASDGFTALIASNIRAERINSANMGGTAAKYIPISIQEAIDLYNKYREKTVSQGSYKNGLVYLQRFKDFFNPSSPLPDIQQEKAALLMLHLRDTNVTTKGNNHAAIKKTLSPQTVLHHYNIYHNMFRFLINNKRYNGTNPFNENVRKLVPEINNEIVRYLSDEQNKKVMSVLFGEYKNNVTHEMIRNIIGFYFASGLRRSEVFKLKMEDIDFDRNIVRLKNPKSGKDKYVELSDLATHFLQLQIKAKKQFKVMSDYIFCTRYGTQRTEIKTQFTTFKKRAGLPHDFRLHDLRHNFATMIASSGGDLYTIQRLLTHSSSDTTQRYAHLTSKRLKEASNKALESLKPPE